MWFDIPLCSIVAKIFLVSYNEYMVPQHGSLSHSSKGNLVAPSTWTTIEVNTTIVCAAIIACRPFFALIFSATPFSHIQSAWSHMQSRISKKKKFFNSSYQLSSGRDACVNSTQSQEPSPILPLFTYPSNDSALRKSTETRNAVSTCEISAERRSGSSEEAL